MNAPHSTRCVGTRYGLVDRPPALAYWHPMVLSRRWAMFLIGVGAWTWVIWPRFAIAIWHDTRAWSTGQIGHGSPTGFLWVHAALILASLAIGSAVGVLGVRAYAALRSGASRRLVRDGQRDESTELS